MLELHKLAVGYIYFYILHLRAKCKVQTEKEMQTWTQMQIFIGQICTTEEFSITDKQNKQMEAVSAMTPFNACLRAPWAV